MVGMIKMMNGVAIWMLLSSLGGAMVMSPESVLLKHEGEAHPFLKAAQDAYKETIHGAGEAARRTGQGIRQTVSSGLHASGDVAHSAMDAVKETSQAGLEKIGLATPEGSKTGPWNVRSETGPWEVGMRDAKERAVGADRAEEVAAEELKLSVQEKYDNWKKYGQMEPPSTTEVVKGKIIGAYDAAKDVAGEATSAVADKTENVAQALKDSMVGAGEKVREGAGYTYKTAEEAAAAVKEKLDAAAEKISDQTYQSAQDAYSKAQEVAAAAKGKLDAATGSVSDQTYRAAHEAYSKAQEVAAAAKEKLDAATESVSDRTSRTAQDAYSRGQEVVAGANEKIGAATGSFSDQSYRAAQDAYRRAQDVAAAAKEKLDAATGSVSDRTYRTAQDVYSRGQEVAAGAKEKLGMATGSVSDQAYRTARDAYGRAQEAAVAAKEKLDAATGSISDQTYSTAQDVYSRAEEVASGAKEKLDAATGTVSEQTYRTAQEAYRRAQEVAVAAKEKLDATTGGVSDQTYRTAQDAYRRAQEAAVAAKEKVEEATKPFGDQTYRTAQEGYRNAQEAVAAAKEKLDKATKSWREGTKESFRLGRDKSIAGADYVGDLASKIVQSMQENMNAAGSTAYDTAGSAYEYAADALQEAGRKTAALSGTHEGLSLLSQHKLLEAINRAADMLRSTGKETMKYMPNLGQGLSMGGKADDFFQSAKEIPGEQYKSANEEVSVTRRRTSGNWREESFIKVGLEDEADLTKYDILFGNIKGKWSGPSDTQKPMENLEMSTTGTEEAVNRGQQDVQKAGTQESAKIMGTNALDCIQSDGEDICVRKTNDDVLSRARDLIDRASGIVHETEEGAKEMNSGEARDSGSDTMAGKKSQPRETSPDTNHEAAEKGPEVSTWKWILSVLQAAHLFAFASSYGTSLWVTFVNGYLLSRAIPRQQFGFVQSKIFPVYLRLIGLGQGICLILYASLHPWASSSLPEKLQYLNLWGIVLSTLANVFFLEPRATKIMFEKLKFEKEEGRGQDTGDESLTASIPKEALASMDDASRERLNQINQSFSVLHGYSSIANLLGLMGETWHLWHLSRAIPI